MGNNFFRLIYYILVIACVGVSSYLSYKGFKSSFGELALPFTFILAIGLFGADALLQRNRERGASVFPPLLIFTCFAVFSTVSNFNHIYTTFMQGDVVRQSLTSEYGVFRNNLTSTRERLLQTDAYKFTMERRADLERELARLESQAFDQLRPGCGERCQVHLRTISDILGKPLSDTAIPPIGSDSDVVRAWYDNVKTAALRDFDALSTTNDFPALSALLEDIDASLRAYDTPDRALAADQGLAVLNTLANESEEIERRANAILPTGSERVQHAKIDRTMGRLGEIVYSLENAFVQRPNILATILSLILASIIDIFPVIFALVAFSPEAGRVGTTQRSRRGSPVPLD